MRKKTGFIKLLRLWGIVLLMALAGVIVGIDLVANYLDLNIHVDNMRTDYVEQQKQASKREVERIVNMIGHEREQTEALAKKEIKSRVFEAFSIVQNIYEQNIAQKSDAEIQKMIVDALKPIRFNDTKGYYFIHSLSGEKIFDPAPLYIEGQEILNLQNSRGEYVVKKELELLGENDEGFLIGFWPKAGRDSTKDFKKISFVKIFKPYNWSIGAGLYVDDIEEQIKATWMERINKIRFGNNLIGYLFVDDWSGKSLAHGAQPDLIGTDMWEYQDSRGNKTTQLLVAASKKKDGGFASFWWRKPDTGKESPKIAYAKAVPEWELFVGSGVYVDDIEKNITTLRETLKAQTNTKILIFIITVAMSFALFFILFHLLSNRLRKDLNLFASFFDQAAFSDKKIDRETVQFAELDQMAESANKMITDRKKAEEEILSAKLFIDRVVEMSPYAMWISDQKGTVIRTNRSLREALNMTNDEIIGEYNVLNDNNMEIQGVLPMVKAVFENHEPAHFSIPWDAAKVGDVNFEDARDLYIDVSIFPIINAEGELTNTVCQWTDITVIKKNEESLRESREKYKSIVDNVGIGVALISPSMEVLELNNQMREWFPEHDLDKRPICYRTFNKPPREEICECCPTSKTLQDGNVHEETTVTLYGDKTRNYRIISSPLINSDGEVTAAIELVEDITDRLNLQTKLLQAQKMESVGRLAGGVAHDFNNMLSVIIGYGEMVLEKVDSNDSLHADIMEILAAAKRSTEITRQLLAFARQQTIAPKVLDPNETIENMLKMLQRLIGEDIDLTWLPGANVWPVKIDPSQVDQILANLCVNSRDAIADVGRVTIETENINFDKDYCANHVGFVPGEYVMLAVSDDGRGIDPKILENIFEPFFTTKGPGEGTGLGLATVYGIVKQNNGFINIYSEQDKGTTIRIYLSRHTGQAIAVNREENLEIPLSRSETILLVEDDDSILNLTKRILEGLGYMVLATTTPNDAVSLAKGHVGELNLLITDVVMPEMNGRELSKQLKSLFPALKILFMSGYTANVIAHRGVLEENVCFIPKPFSKRDLALKVRESLDSENI